MNNSKLLVLKETLEELERLYPNRCPSLSDEERVVWFKAGQVSVVQKLRQVFDNACENHFTR